MSSLRLGVLAAVIDDEDRLLLSRRADLDVWGLPGGRLDPGETLLEAAAREVREETGVVAQLDRAVGLYYLEGWRRLNVLFAGWPLGGALQRRTFETRANQYFARHELPATFHDVPVRDALDPTRPPPRILRSDPAELRRIRQRLRLRWMVNLLRGRPEPRYPHFDVRAVALVWDGTGRRVLAVEGRRGAALPRLRLDGHSAPWDALAVAVARQYGLTLAFAWAGLWHDPARGVLELVFAAQMAVGALAGGGAWIAAQNSALGDRDGQYVAQTSADFAAASPWLLWAADDDAGDLLVAHG